MVNRRFGGNGSSKGFTNVMTMGPGWVLSGSATARSSP
jgi:hypothetical protein